MRIVKISVLLVISLAMFAAERREGGGIYKVGVTQRQYHPQEPYNWRGADTHALLTTIWYPADPAAVEQPQWIGSQENPFASLGKSAPDAKVATFPAHFPL